MTRVTTSLSQDYIQFTVNDGLPSNLVYGAIKDAEGFIWFFTDNGVAKYDGYEFKVFNADDGIKDSDIWHIHEDKYLRKWLISSTSLGYYIENDSVKHIEKPIDRSIYPQDINFIDEGFVYKYQGLLHMMIKDELLSFPFDSTQSVEVVTKALRKIDASESLINKITEYLSDVSIDIELDQYFSKFPYNVRNETFAFQSTQYIIKVVDRNLVMINIKKNSEAVIKFDDYGIEKVLALNKKENVLDIHHSQGIISVNLDDERVISNHFLPFLKHKLTRTLVDKNFIIGGSFHDGAIISSPFFNKSKLLTGESINTIGVDINHNIQLLTDKNEIYSYNPKDQTTSKIFEEDKRLQKENILKKDKRLYLLFDQTILDIGSNEVLLQGDNDSIARTDSDDINMYLTNSNDIVHMDSSMLVQWYNVLYSIGLNNNSHNYVGKLGLQLSCIERFQGDILVGTSNGLFKIDASKSQLFSKFSPLPEDNISDLRNMGNQWLVMVTDNTNLHIWNDSIWVSDRYFNSPITNLCFAKSYIYGLTADHLFRINVENNYKIEKFYFQGISGLGRVISIECIDELIIMGTEDGFYKMHHQDLKTIEDSPRITDLNVYNNQGLIEGDKLKCVSNTYNSLRFEFKTLSIISLGNVEYSYRLLPSELEWNTTKDLEAVYTSLSTNDYVFEVFVTDAFDNKSEIRSLDIKIHPAWYKSIGFYVAASLFLVVLVSMIYFFRLKNIQKSEEKKTLMNKKIAQYELQALRAQMNPHFIFNVLSSIQNAIRNQDVETADDHLFNFATLIRKFLDFSEKRYLILQEELDLIKLYTNIENLRFDPRIDVQFEVDPNLDTDSIMIPSMLVQPIVENAINHGLFYKKDDRKLILSFENKDQDLLISILDNGVGRDVSNKKNKRRATNYTSKGILNIRSRIEILNQSEEVKIKYSIEDLKDKNNKAEGTLVKLLILNHDTKSNNNRR